MGGGGEWVWLKELCMGTKAGGCQGGNASPSHLKEEIWTPGLVLEVGEERSHHQHTLQEQQPPEEGTGRNPKG